MRYVSGAEEDRVQQTSVEEYPRTSCWAIIDQVVETSYYVGHHYSIVCCRERVSTLYTSTMSRAEALPLTAWP